MELTFPRLNKRSLSVIGSSLLAAGLLLAAGFASSGWWLPAIRGMAAQADANDATKKQDAHAGHGADEADSIKLSEQGLKNVGFKPLRIELGTFVKTVTMPAMVVELPGRSQIDVTAPMTGIVTKIYAIEGEAIIPGQRLFELRLTHEDLVTAQRDFLRTVEELDVVRREIKRLEAVGDGVIAGKRVLDRKYEEQKLVAGLHAQRQGLLLHGITAAQIDDISTTRNLLQSVTISAPLRSNGDKTPRPSHLFHLQELCVKSGQQVAAGVGLGVLADHRNLYIEGMAFEEDAERLNQVAKDNGKVSAVLVLNGKSRGAVENLEILYLSDRVERESRALKFYIALPNVIVRDQMKNGHRFIGWKFKPGQRMQVRVPVKRLEQRIVLPVDAIVDEGAEIFVFRMNGSRFDRVAVHVEERSQDQVAIANDGALFPGDVVAAAGAYEMYLELKKKAGGGVDPHAGHNH